MAVLLNTSLLAGIFHQFPHLDFNFYNTTTIFTPDDTRYQQALIFNGIYLFFASLVLFFIFTIYFLVCSCYFCTNCRPQPLKPKPYRSRCLRLLICFLSILSCFALGVAFFANNKAHEGTNEFSQSATNFYDLFDLYKFKNVVISRYIDNGVIQVVEHLEDELSRRFSNSSENLTRIHEINLDVKLGAAMRLLDGANVNTSEMAQNVSEYDTMRWWVTLAALLWHGLLVLVVIYSTYTQRRCSFIVLTIMAVISLLLMMSIVSVDTPLSIGSADLCHSPRKSMLQYAKGEKSREVLAHFIDCRNSSENPLKKAYKNFTNGLYEAKDLAASLKNDPLIKQLNDSQKSIRKIQKSIRKSIAEQNELFLVLQCEGIHKNFVRGVNSVCNVVLDGLGLLILSTLIIVILLIFVLLCITPVWKAMTPLRPILKRDKFGVHLVTDSYQGPPGGSESFHGSSSFDVSYKSIDDQEEFEHVPLISKRDRPPSYRTIQGSTEFLSVEEDDKRTSRNDDDDWDQFFH